MIIDRKILEELLAAAKESPRLRMVLDLRDSEKDQSQRMLNAMLPGTEVPIHRHETTSEMVAILYGRLTEVYYDENGQITEKITLDLTLSKLICKCEDGSRQYRFKDRSLSPRLETYRTNESSK